MFGRPWGFASALCILSCGEAIRAPSDNTAASSTGGQQAASGGASSTGGVLSAGGVVAVGGQASGAGRSTTGSASVWLEPVAPPQVPGQHTGPGCPEIEPTKNQACSDIGLECAFPACWGATSRSWVCTEAGFTNGFDGSSLCDPSRPCPASPPAATSACGLPGLRCIYRLDCCGKDAGFTEARCGSTAWEVEERPLPLACPECSPFPVQGDACSIEAACTSGAPPAVCLRPTCYGGTDVARCNGSIWEVTFGCRK